MLTFFKPAEVRRDFGRAAHSYDDHAGLQREVLARAAARLAHYLPVGTVLDAGCGTGSLAQAAPRAWQLAGVDIAAPMCAQAGRNMPVACADVTALPLRDASVDGLLCSLVLQWVNDHAAAFSEFRRVIRPGGYMVATVFGPDTLKELREVLGGRVSEFPTLEQFAAEAEGWQVVEQESTCYSYYYSSLFGLMMSLKFIGASNKLVGRKRGLTTPGVFKRAEEMYQKSFGNGRGVCATWQVHTLVLKA